MRRCQIQQFSFLFVECKWLVDNKKEKNFLEWLTKAQQLGIQKMALKE